jgi:enoyl-CoA hydratase/carnithine racemase
VNIEVVRADGVVWVTIDRPDELNCLSHEMYGQLADVMVDATADGSVDVVVITGSGRAFSTGGDLKQVLAAFAAGDAEVSRVTQLFAESSMRMFQAIEATPKTVVAMVNGICQAGGLSLALCSDIVVASARATFCVPEGKVGIADPYAPTRLARRVGVTAAKWLLMTADTVGADEALAMGMVNRVLPHESLLEGTREIVARIQATSPTTRAAYKKCIALDNVPFDRDVMVKANAGQDAAEGIAAFVGKRRPVWPSRELV